MSWLRESVLRVSVPVALRVSQVEALDSSFCSSTWVGQLMSTCWTAARGIIIEGLGPGTDGWRASVSRRL